jgi:DNA polymerase-1
MSRTVIIDGDILVYKVSTGIVEEFELEALEDEECIFQTVSWGNKEQAKQKVDDLIEKITKDTKSTDYIIALSDATNNFRKTINPNYKGNRKKIKPILWKFLREYLTTNHKTYEKPNLEADDVIGILATSEKIIKDDKVVWSMDKDFKTIPCKFRREFPNGTHESKIIYEDEADWWFMYQTLIGDKVDGYDGCKGVGDKTARKILGDVGEKSLKEMWKLVKATYTKAGFTEEDALRNARMARILRSNDYDFKKKEVKLWQMAY